MPRCNGVDRGCNITPHASGPTSVWSCGTKKSGQPLEEARQMTAAEKHAGAASPGYRKWLRVSIVQVCQVVRDTASRKGRLQGSSCMHGNVPVQFLGVCP